MKHGMRRVEASRVDGGFTVIENKFIRDPSIKRNEKVVYMVLASFADNITDEAYPSIKKIEELANLTDKPVMAALRSLEKLGWIRSQRRKNTSTMYWIGKSPVGIRNSSDNPIGETPNKQDSINKTKEQDSGACKEIIEYLNRKTGRRYDWRTPKTQRMIKARMSHPNNYKIDSFKLVIDHKVREWMKDPKMKMFLRPETLFGTKMEGYFEIAFEQLENEEN